MSYTVFFRASARKELNDCCDTYGTGLHDDIVGWLRGLAVAAERNDGALSIDLGSVLEDIADEVAAGAISRRWKYAVQKWRASNVWGKVKGFIAFLKTRRPPWELRSSICSFTFLERCRCEVHVYYEVDHVNRRIVVAKFDGLPGQ